MIAGEKVSDSAGEEMSNSDATEEKSLIKVTSKPDRSTKIQAHRDGEAS